MKKKWGRTQRKLHKKLYLEYRKQELVWYLDIHLCLHHPQHVVDRFVKNFLEDKLTVKQCFASAVNLEWTMGYDERVPYQTDLTAYIAWMLYRQYIIINDNMKFSQIMKLDRTFLMSVGDRYLLRDKLLNHAA